MDKHTPTPWHAWGNEICGTDPHDFDDIVIGVLGKSSGTRSHEYHTAKKPETIAANAALIIEAINSHDPLLEAVKVLSVALERAADFIKSEYRSAEAEALEGHFMAREARPTWEAVCSALARAEELTDGLSKQVQP